MNEKQEQNQILKAAQQYVSNGFSVIPIVAGQKTPSIAWKKYQQQIAANDVIERWWYDGSKAGIAIVTGSISKLVVVDVDPKNGGEDSMKKLHLPPTHIVKTGGGGWHYYYAWPWNKPVPNIKGFLDGVDIEGEAAYVVVPPSKHPSGEIYTSITSLDDIIEAPEWLQKLEADEEKLWKKETNEIKEGERNQTAASVCGKILSALPENLWQTAGWGGLKEWNAELKQPLSEKELRAVFESIAKKAQSNDKLERESNQSVAKKILDLVLAQRPQFFHNDLEKAFAHIQVADHKEIHAINSLRFRNWAIRQYWRDENKPPKSEHVKQALDLIRSLAIFDGEKINLSNRVAGKDGSIFYDLTDDKWQVIKINSTGWKIVENPPIMFRRYTHQQSQIMPVIDGDISVVLQFVNLKDKHQQLLFLVYLVSCFVPDIPHPIPVLYGSQGAAKSTFLRVLRRIIDPSSLELLSFPTKKAQLVQQLSHHWAPYYDNVTTIPEWLSDSLCRAVTGEGFSKRELYTDDEDVIYSFKCCIGINGINIAAQKADLLDRSILFGLERIDSKQRKDETKFWNDFKELQPIIIGGVFNTLAKAIEIRPSIILEELPRMADFALWGCAIAKALGYEQEEFLTAYQANLDEQNEEAIREHPVATAVRSFMEKREYAEWQGSSTELLNVLEVIAEEQSINIKQKLWPKAPQALSRRLNEVKTNLNNIGIVINTSHGAKRLITISGDGINDNSDINEQATLDFIKENLDPTAHFID